MYGKGAVGHIVEFMDKSMEFKESHPSAAEWSGCIWGAAGAQGAYNIGMSDQLEYDPIEVVQFGAVAALSVLIVDQLHLVLRCGARSSV